MKHVKRKKNQKCMQKNSYVFDIKLVEEINKDNAVSARLVDPDVNRTLATTR